MRNSREGLTRIRNREAGVIVRASVGDTNASAALGGGKASTSSPMQTFIPIPMQWPGEAFTNNGTVDAATRTPWFYQQRG